MKRNAKCCDICKGVEGSYSEGKSKYRIERVSVVCGEDFDICNLCSWTSVQMSEKFTEEQWVSLYHHEFKF